MTITTIKSNELLEEVKRDGNINYSWFNYINNRFNLSM